ncbi:MAG: hypothetical protein JOS17DRAFT_728152 [Linnemannia elongata]|nr:MAG: hypothetical protein JOS17DRAFT_728152 [Linnemannia elongata]
MNYHSPSLLPQSTSFSSPTLSDTSTQHLQTRSPSLPSSTSSTLSSLSSLSSPSASSPTPPPSTSNTTSNTTSTTTSPFLASSSLHEPCSLKIRTYQGEEQKQEREEQEKGKEENSNRHSSMSMSRTVPALTGDGCDHHRRSDRCFRVRGMIIDTNIDDAPDPNSNCLKHTHQQPIIPKGINSSQDTSMATMDMVTVNGNVNDNNDRCV